MSYKNCVSQVIDSKRRDYGCFGLANDEMTGVKEKREQAPALHMELSTGLSVSQNKGKSRKILRADCRRRASHDSRQTIPSTLRCPRHYLRSKFFQRTHDSARAFLSAPFASGASPPRCKPCPAPSYVSGS